MEQPATSRISRMELASRADLCASALVQARQLATRRDFGPRLDGLIAQTFDLLDDTDEVLIRLHPHRDHDVFAHVTALRRQLEAIQSLVSDEKRSHYRRA